ncbi:MAG TPA: hypothetical protein VNT76_14325 [Candidatus Binatus sp.]|nr:hypothetical protein [Candidatus Binatus sp.]
MDLSRKKSQSARIIFSVYRESWCRKTGLPRRLSQRQDRAAEEFEDLLEAAVGVNEFSIETGLLGEKFLGLVQHHRIGLFGIFSKDTLSELRIVIPDVDPFANRAHESQPNIRSFLDFIFSYDQADILIGQIVGIRYEVGLPSALAEFAQTVKISCAGSSAPARFVSIDAASVD